LKANKFFCAFLSALTAVKALCGTASADLYDETSRRASDALSCGSGYIDFSDFDIRGEDFADAISGINSAWSESCVFHAGDINIAAATYELDYSSDERGDFLKGAVIYYRADYIRADGTCDVSQLREDIDTVSRKFTEALSIVSEDMSDYEKALAFHDCIVRRTEYAEKSMQPDGTLDYSADEYTAVGVFLDGRAVCSGYASAYAALLRASGIDAVVVNSAEMNHDWTMLKIDGDWYHADCTWDDAENGVIYDYFLKNDAQFKELGHYGWTVGMDEGYGGYGAAAPLAVGNADFEVQMQEENTAENEPESAQDEIAGDVPQDTSGDSAEEQAEKPEEVSLLPFIMGFYVVTALVLVAMILGTNIRRAIDKKRKIKERQQKNQAQNNGKEATK